MEMKLTDPVARSFHVVRDFSETAEAAQKIISGIDFSADGKHLVSCENDDKIAVYDCDEGSSKFSINTKKYGGGLIIFNPKQNCVIHSSTKFNDDIRYLSLDGKGYLRYFPGHTKRVISLSMSPEGNSFLSGSMDHTVRLWDLNSSHSQAVLRSSGQIIATHDPEGIIFAAGVDSEFVKLYDLRSFEKGPFDSFKLEPERNCEWTGMKFSADGKTILISTNGHVTRLIDAYSGKPKMTIKGKLQQTHATNISKEIFFDKLKFHIISMHYIYRTRK